MTTWTPRTNFERRSWLLTNGEIAQEPELEESPSGRKVRIAGTKISAYSRDIDELVGKGLEVVATQKQTAVWMPLDEKGAALRSAVGFTPEHQKAILHLVHTEWHSTVAWWRFRHRSLPIEALVHIHAYTRGERHSIHTRVAAPLTIPGRNFYPVSVVSSDCRFTNIESHLRDYDSRLVFEEFMRDSPAEWADVLGDVTHIPTERQAISKLLGKVRELENLERIQIPDLRDESQPAWLDLELYDTNVNAAFIQDMVDYLDSAPSVEVAAKLYNDLLTTFRQIGLVLEGKSENQFQQALLAGDESALTVRLGKAHLNGNEADSEHVVSVHLPTGTFVVTCSAKPTDKNKIAEKWDEALMLASLTGKEDELLAYARRYAETEHARRTKQVLSERSLRTETDE